jgi:hypothetical protein
LTALPVEWAALDAHGHWANCARATRDLDRAYQASIQGIRK